MTEKIHPTDSESQEYQLQRKKLRLQARRQKIEQHRMANESINTLLAVVRYLNSVQDGDGLRIEDTYTRTNIDKRSRILNCHEEDLMNVSLIAMKRLIASLIPTPTNSTHPASAIPNEAPTLTENF